MTASVSGRAASQPIRKLTASFIRLTVPAALLAIALSCQRLLYALLLPGLQIKRVTLDLLDDVLLQDLALKTLQRALQALAFMYLNFGQWVLPRLDSVVSLSVTSSAETTRGY
jgi:hypothetical protein